MSAADELLKPQECVMLLVDFQAGLGLAVESASRQVVLNSAVALARVGCWGEWRRLWDGSRIREMIHPG